MKPVPAIVEPAQIDVDLVAEQIIVARNELASVESKIARLKGEIENAIGAAKMRRIDMGRLLTRVRPQWPERGPQAKGWGEFLRRVGIDDSTAYRYMREYEDPDGFTQNNPLNPPERNDSRSGVSEMNPDHRPAANVNGGSGNPLRGKYCTPKKWAEAVGLWDLDPFSNPRSHVAAAVRCMLEDGGDGLANPALPGTHRAGAGGVPSVATAGTRVFIQPDYSYVEEAIAHYKHTRFCALLRFAPETGWFDEMWPHVEAIAIPRERIPFEAPDGIEADGAPFPHVFYYAAEADITDEMRSLCIVLRVEHEPYDAEEILPEQEAR
jgi:hypothetical protein